MPSLMRTTHIVVGLFVAATFAAYSKNSLALDPLPRDLEIQLALSAAPEKWQQDATVYVLDPATGYEMAREGTSGFACLVGRTNWRKPRYYDNLLVPICYDPEGVETTMVVRFEIEALRARGVSKQELFDTIKSNFASGSYKTPTRNGLSPMLSPLLMAFPGPVVEPVLLNYPHLMFYAPGVTNEMIGGRPLDPVYPWVLGEDGGPHTLIIQPIGEAEKTRINVQYKDLTDAICKLNDSWCLPEN